MISATGCTVTLENGTVLRRQRVVLGADGIFRSFDRRTNKLQYEVVAMTFEQFGKKKWTITTDAGFVGVIKSGCGCGR